MKIEKGDFIWAAKNSNIMEKFEVVETFIETDDVYVQSNKEGKLFKQYKNGIFTIYGNEIMKLVCKKCWKVEK